MRKYAAGAIRAERPYGSSVFLLSARAGGGLARVTAATMSAGNARYLHTTRSTDQLPARRFQPLIASNSFVPGAAEIRRLLSKARCFQRLLHGKSVHRQGGYRYTHRLLQQRPQIEMSRDDEDRILHGLYYYRESIDEEVPVTSEQMLWLAMHPLRE